MIEDVVRRIVGSATRSRDVANTAGQDADVALAEPGRGFLAEDEVRGANDQAFGE